MIMVLQDAVGAAAVLLQGDAAMTAHYRLGVGVNNAFASMMELRSLLTDLTKLSSSLNHHGANQPAQATNRRQTFSRLVARRETTAASRVTRVVKRQVAAVFFETQCPGVVVFGTGVYLRKQERSLEFEQLSAEQITTLGCVQAWRVRATRDHHIN